MSTEVSWVARAPSINPTPQPWAIYVWSPLRASNGLWLLETFGKNSPTQIFCKEITWNYLKSKSLRIHWLEFEFCWRETTVRFFSAFWGLFSMQRLKGIFCLPYPSRYGCWSLNHAPSVPCGMLLGQGCIAFGRIGSLAAKEQQVTTAISWKQMGRVDVSTYKCLPTKNTINWKCCTEIQQLFEIEPLSSTKTLLQ